MGIKKKNEAQQFPSLWAEMYTQVLGKGDRELVSEGRS